MQDRSGATTRGASKRSQSSAKACWVLVCVGGGDLRLFGLAAGVELVLGRDVDCDIVLEHHRVSRRHARLRVTEAGEELTVEDLGSRTGTRVGERLDTNRPREVRPGGAIAIGPFTMLAMRGPPGQAAASLVIDDPLGIAPSQVLVSVARSPANILVVCEPDRGMHLLAETMHRLAGRTGPLVSIACGSVTAGQLQRDLAAATSGTVFLDDIEALSPPLQNILLHPADRPGPRGNKEMVALLPRFISSSPHDLPAAVDAGAFREDLYYRLGCITFVIPPLRARRAKIAPMAQELLAAAAARAGLSALELSDAAAARLTAHDWPGNLGELESVLARALELSGGGPAIELAHLELEEPAPASADAAALAPAIRDRPTAGSFDLGALRLDEGAEPACELVSVPAPPTGDDGGGGGDGGDGGA